MTRNKEGGVGTSAGLVQTSFTQTASSQINVVTLDQNRGQRDVIAVDHLVLEDILLVLRSPRETDLEPEVHCQEAFYA